MKEVYYAAIAVGLVYCSVQVVMRLLKKECCMTEKSGVVNFSNQYHQTTQLLMMAQSSKEALAKINNIIIIANCM